MLSVIKYLVLTLCAIIGFIIIEPISFIYVVFFKEKPTLERASGYLGRLALSIDRFINYQYASLLNKIFIDDAIGYKFGSFNETISSVLGRNELLSNVMWYEYRIFGKKILTYRKFGKSPYKPLGILANRFLYILDKNHCILSIGV